MLQFLQRLHSDAVTCSLVPVQVHASGFQFDEFRRERWEPRVFLARRPDVSRDPVPRFVPLLLLRRSYKVPLYLPTRGDTSFAFAWGAFIARSILKTMDNRGRTVRSPFVAVYWEFRICRGRGSNKNRFRPAALFRSPGHSLITLLPFANRSTQVLAHYKASAVRPLLSAVVIRQLDINSVINSNNH